MRSLVYITLFWVFVSFSGHAWAADSKDDCKQFAEHLRQKMLDIIQNDHQGFLAKHQALVTLFRDAVMIDASAQYAAGDYWDDATQQERNAYLKAYSAYLPNFYIGSFDDDDLKGIANIIISEFTETSPKHYLARTEITQKYDEPIHADFEIVASDSGKCSIYDFTTEGVSMMKSQREEMENLGEKGGLPFITQNLEAHARND